ncbi:GL16014 [Drosophila persimilis]|uniref:Proline dehydrogenase n=1 Tax=Drosophila persimilis TaxID=7234 RepID=B4H9X6_DROPE|nr:GL16014 [Drosophila persimilis]
MALLRSLRTQRTTYLINSRTSVSVSSSSSVAAAAKRHSLHTTAALEADVQASSQNPSQEQHVQAAGILRRRQQHHQLLSRLIYSAGAAGVGGSRQHTRYVHSGQNGRQSHQLAQSSDVEGEALREKRQLGKSASPKPSGTPAARPARRGLQRSAYEMVEANIGATVIYSIDEGDLLRPFCRWRGSDQDHTHTGKLLKLARNLLGQKLFVLLMKSSFYGHFVAGENRHTIVPTLERLRSFGVKPILDYSVEEDISQEEAEKREVESSVSSAGDNKEEGTMPQYHVDKSFADRRYKVSSARTYFYLNEATCERNMETFIKCLEAVSDDDRKVPRATATGATFGTGITAIKLTALGRPQLLLQLSEVIMRTRKYMEDMVGGQGNVLTHHKTIKDLEKYYATLGDNKNVQDFLKNVTSDKEGILHLFPWVGNCGRGLAVERHVPCS